MLNSSIWSIDRTLSSDTTPSQSGPESYGNEGVFCIPQISSITGASQSDCLVSYPGHSLVGRVLPLQRCSQSILPLQLTEPLYQGSFYNKYYENSITWLVFSVTVNMYRIMSSSDSQTIFCSTTTCQDYDSNIQRQGKSKWCRGWHIGYSSLWVQTPVKLLCALLDLYLWERY